MEFANKKELCEVLKTVMAITQYSMNDLIGEAKSLEEASENLDRKLTAIMKESTNFVIIKELRRIQYNNDSGKRLGKDYDTEYERLMRWIAKDYSDQPSSIKRKLNAHNLMLNVSSMDMFCVIKGNHDYRMFKHDIEQRTGKRYV